MSNNKFPSSRNKFLVGSLVLTSIFLLLLVFVCYLAYPPPPSKKNYAASSLNKSINLSENFSQPNS